MPGVSTVRNGSQEPFSKGSVTCFPHSKDINEDSSSVLTEINLNTGASPSPHSLKRKRPLSIQIPLVSQQPQEPKLTCRERQVQKEVVEINTSCCSVFSKKGKGKNKVMEDAHKIVSHLNVGVKKGFFGVYDGHGGRKAAEFVAENLHGNILGMLEKCGSDTGKEEAVKAGYLKTDEEFLRQGLSSGTCCVTALIEQGHIVVSNLGDCRAVLCRGGIAEAVTIDHKAERVDERNRIEEKGGYVDIHHGAWRVQGTLAVSRSIGDVHLKEWVLAEPDTEILPLTSDMEFLILASDGLWDKVGNQEAISTTIDLLSVLKHPVSVSNELKEDEDVFANENSPPLKMRRISFGIQKKTRVQCTNQDKNYKSTADWNEEASDSKFSHSNFGHSGTNGNDGEEDENEFGNENSLPSKVRRISLSIKHKTRFQSPNQDISNYSRSTSADEAKNTAICSHLDFENSRTGVNDWKKGEEDMFDTENHPESKVPPSVQQNPSAPCPNRDDRDNISTSSRFLAACQELVSLAVKRGSLDDITVMIIDLKQFHHS